MYQGYLKFGDMEIINVERTVVYAQQFLPGVDLRNCEECANLFSAIGDTDYTEPPYDPAPWYRAGDPATGEFYGMYPLSISGVDDSSLRVTRTEFTGDGASHSRPRVGSKEIRVRGVLVASTEDGLDVGKRWLRSTLDNPPCGRIPDCDDRELVYFTACPGSDVIEDALLRAVKYRRTMYRVAVLDSMRVIRDYHLQNGYLAEVEFVLSVGTPWAFTDLEAATTTTGVTGIPITGEAMCPPITNSFDDLVLDTAGPIVVRPPTPPTLAAREMSGTYYRYMAVIPQSQADRWGRLVPVITIRSPDNEVLRMVRVRFYRDINGLPGIDYPVCDWIGEFLMTYIPNHTYLTIDGATQESTLRIFSTANAAHSAGHLVVGDNGRPPTWPNMQCDGAYLVVVDSDIPLPSGSYVTVQVRIGE